MQKNVECPVDFVLINYNQVRTTAALVLFTSVWFIISGSWVAAILIAVDFLLRAFKLGTYSPLNVISGVIVDFWAETIPINQAPKIFAAKIGLIFSLGIILLLIFNLVTAAKVIACVLAVFSLLESFFGFCAGCYMYKLLHSKFPRKEVNQQECLAID